MWMSLQPLPDVTNGYAFKYETFVTKPTKSSCGIEQMSKWDITSFSFSQAINLTSETIVLVTYWVYLQSGNRNQSNQEQGTLDKLQIPSQIW